MASGIAKAMIGTGNSPTASGTYLWKPPVADLILEVFERLQIFPPALTTHHIISARRSANLICQGYSNKGLNLWAVGDQQIAIPLLPGVSSYTLPANTVDVLDSYIRTYQPSITTVNLGNPLNPMLTAGATGTPMVQANGEPMITGPGSGVLSSVIGSQEITMRWPNHQLQPGAPLFFTTPVSIGTLMMMFGVVTSVPSPDTLTYLASMAAPETSLGMGATPLFATTAGSSTVNVILPNHGLSAGQTFNVQIPTSVGGMTLGIGTYNVTARLTPPSPGVASYEFQIATNGVASVTTAVFENLGQIQVASQAAGIDPVDVLIYPISRNDYAAIPDKFIEGRPTTYWFDRTIIPSVSLWQVPPPGPPYYAFVAYRLRELQDVNAYDGQSLDMPRRFYYAFCASLCASLAEKFKPEAFASKLQYAEALWSVAAEEDREKVTWNGPEISQYYNE